MVATIGTPHEGNNRKHFLNWARKELPDLHLYEHHWRNGVYEPLAQRFDEVQAMVMPVVDEVGGLVDPWLRMNYAPSVAELKNAFECRDPQKCTKALYAFLQDIELE